MKLTQELLQYATLGGCFLGGGGGGSIEKGMQVGRAALMYAAPTLVSIDDIPADTLIVTASTVGAPAAKQVLVTPKDYVKAVQILEQHLGCTMAGVITNENGGTATINGWIQSAVLGLPLVDAPCNGRAHPTGTMGSMGLNAVPGFISHQVAVGGDPELGKHVEICVSGSLDVAASIVRKTADASGGMVAVARNPVSAAYIKENGAIGGITHAIETGKAFAQAQAKGAKAAMEAVADFLNGEVITIGKVTTLKLETINAFDVGFVTVDGFEITFWNEYMTLEKGSKRFGTFPDLIMTMDALTGMPVTSAELREGQEVAILVTDRKNLKLGAGVKDKTLLKEIEPIINRSVL